MASAYLMRYASLSSFFNEVSAAQIPAIASDFRYCCFGVYDFLELFFSLIFFRERLRVSADACEACL